MVADFSAADSCYIFLSLDQFPVFHSSDPLRSVFNGAAKIFSGDWLFLFRLYNFTPAAGDVSFFDIFTFRLLLVSIVHTTTIRGS